MSVSPLIVAMHACALLRRRSQLPRKILDWVMAPPKVKKIAFILVDGFSMMSLSSASEPLRAANFLSDETLYSCTFIPADGTIAKASSGFTKNGKPLFENGYDFDLVLVAAAGAPAVYQNEPLFRYLKLLASKRIPLGGISGGPVLLARAGLMDNRRFTVHWDHRVAMAELSSEFLLERSLYVIDRDRYTCAGGIAPLDMMSAIITADHGNSLAKRVNDWFIYTNVREATDPQRTSLVDKYQIHHPAVLSAIELMQNHLSDPLSTEQLAHLSGIGERQLGRMFKKLLGKNPNAFYTQLRMEHAKVLTLQTSLPIIEIAVASGYESASYFAQKFKTHFGVTPTELRSQPPAP